MEIKSFQAKDMAEALRLVKAEFGPDAMILTSKKVRRKGFLGLFTKHYFEVTALLDNRPRANFSEQEQAKELVNEPNTMEEFQKSMLAPLARELKELRSRVELLSVTDEKSEPQPALRKLPDSDAPLTAESRDGIEDLKRFLLRSMEVDKGVVKSGAVSNGKPLKEPAAPELRSDIEELKRILLNSMVIRKDGLSQATAVVGPALVAELNGCSTEKKFPAFQVSGGSDSGNVRPQTQLNLPAGVTMHSKPRGSEASDLKQVLQRFQATEAQSDAESSILAPTVGDAERNHLKILEDLLRTNGVNDEEIEDLLASPAMASLRGESLDQLRERLHEAITASVLCSKQVTLKNDSPRILALVGPTGVGKTTTIAKLAVLAVKQRLRVAIITINTYHIGAVDQLKAYATIMGLPLSVAETPDELVSAINANSDKQLIFIDTAGCNPRDQKGLMEIKSFLEVHPVIETHLCLSATTRDRELTQIFNRFSILPVSRLLFTKLDESESFGCIINTHLKHKVPLSYFATGQKVPDDLQVASSKKIADLVLGVTIP